MSHIAYEEAILLDYLTKRKLFSDTILILEEVAPCQGFLIIQFEDRSEVLGRKIALRIVTVQPGVKKPGFCLIHVIIICKITFYGAQVGRVTEKPGF